MGDLYFLKTERLGFRCWQETDFDLAMTLWGDPAVTARIDTRGTLSREQVLAKLREEQERLETFGVQYWPIFQLADDGFVGCCGLRPYPNEQGVFELGFHICSRYWRLGFAREAAKSVIDFAFTEFKAKALFAGHSPENTASKQLLEKLGFRFTHFEFYKPTALDHPSYRLER